MERKFYTDDFEQLLKEQTDDFRMYPSKRVWHSIYNEMHPARRWPSVAVSMLLILTLLLVGYWNSPSSQISTALATSSPNNLNPAVAIENSSNNNSTNYTLSVTGSKTTKVQPPIVNTNNNVARNTTPKTTAPLSSGAGVFINSNTEDAANTNVQQNSNQTAKNTTTITNTCNNNPANTAAGLTAATAVEDELVNENGNTIQLNTPELNRVIITAPVADNEIPVTNINENKAVRVNGAADKKPITTEDKVWMEDYAFHNKSKRKKWHDRTASEIYFTPSIGYRNFSSNTTVDLNSVNSFAGSPVTGSLEAAVNQKPGLGLEIGAGLVYNAAKNIRLKIGVQANYTSYIINASETNHPTLTNIMLNDDKTGYPYMESRASTLSNISGYKTSHIPNTSYQLSLPVGFALKLAGNSNLEWYAGATIQPTFVFGGKANLLSFDRKNYVKDPSMIRQWNLNSGIETYIHYKFAGSTLQIGPQFRYQLGSTYSKKYTLTENLYNVGIKVGLLKNF